MKLGTTTQHRQQTTTETDKKHPCRVKEMYLKTLRQSCKIDCIDTFQTEKEINKNRRRMVRRKKKIMIVCCCWSFFYKWHEIDERTRDQYSGVNGQDIHPKHSPSTNNNHHQNLYSLQRDLRRLIESTDDPRLLLCYLCNNPFIMHLLMHFYSLLWK